MLLYVYGKQHCHVMTVNCLTILLLGKPSRGSLPVVSAYFSVSNLQLALLKSEEEGKNYERKCRTQKFISGPLAYKSDTLPIELLSMVGWLRIGLIWKVQFLKDFDINYHVTCKYIKSLKNPEDLNKISHWV